MNNLEEWLACCNNIQPLIKTQLACCNSIQPLIKTQPTATNHDVVHIQTKQLCIQRTCIAYKFVGEKLSLREIVIDGLFVWCILYIFLLKFCIYYLFIDFNKRLYYEIVFRHQEESLK